MMPNHSTKISAAFPLCGPNTYPELAYNQQTSPAGFFVLRSGYAV